MAGSRRISKGPLEVAFSKAGAPDLPRDASLSSEAEEMIAAWNGGKVKYHDGEAPAAPQPEDDNTPGVQSTEEMDIGDRCQVRLQATTPKSPDI